MKKRQKMEILKKIVSMIKDKEEVLFAYVFGSFARKEEFSDIDIAVYIKGNADIKKEFALENEMEEILKIPVDVRIINNAPISFVYNVLRDKILIKDNENRADYEGQNGVLHSNSIRNCEGQNGVLPSNFIRNCEGQILKRYFDYVHLLDEYLEEAAHA